MKKAKKHSVLLIDDSDVNTTMLSNILSPDYKILVAKCGHEGIELAKTKTPDIIILDVVMPDISGYDVIVMLKKAVSTRNIPVIFITSLANLEDETKGLSLGGSDYITKPFCKEIVKLRVQNQSRILNYIDTIERLSRIDQLTGLPNRRSVHERSLSEWKLAIREGTTLSVLIIDIDHFKKCNDTYGHLMGDVVLQKTAKAISHALNRPSDFAARWGGEEFIVLLPKTESEGAAIIAESIRKSVEDVEIPFADGRSTRVTISIGVNTHSPTKKCSIDDLLNYADDALYIAKKRGRNNVAVYKDNVPE